jgi:hypothetical protein
MPRTKGLPIHLAHCNSCTEDFFYIPGVVNSVTGRNSDTYGIPKCPTCGYRNTVFKGQVRIIVWSVRRSPYG